MTWLLLFKNIKYIGVIALAVAVVWFYKDYKKEKAENVRIIANAIQERRFDSIKYSEQTLTKEELIGELRYNRSDLLAKLEEQDIKLNRITRIISTKQTYIDTTKVSIILKGLLEAIEQKKEIKVPFKDSTACMVIEGNLYYNGEDIRLENLSKKFENSTDIVAFLEKKPFWKFWKWGKKRKITVTVLNSCGESETKIIDVEK